MPIDLFLMSFNIWGKWIIHILLNMEVLTLGFMRYLVKKKENRKRLLTKTCLFLFLRPNYLLSIGGSLMETD